MWFMAKRTLLWCGSKLYVVSDEVSVFVAVIAVEALLINSLHTGAGSCANCQQHNGGFV